MPKPKYWYWHRVTEVKQQSKKEWTGDTKVGQIIGFRHKMDEAQVVNIGNSEGTEFIGVRYKFLKRLPRNLTTEEVMKELGKVPEAE